MSHVYFRQDGRNLCQWCLSHREVEVEPVMIDDEAYWLCPKCTRLLSADGKARCDVMPIPKEIA